MDCVSICRSKLVKLMNTDGEQDMTPSDDPNSKASVTRFLSDSN